MNQYITIKKGGITSEDIEQVVCIHRQEIGQGFLSSLGNKALQPIFSLAAENRSGILLIAKDETQGHLCGFLLGTIDTGMFYRDFLLKKSFNAVISFLPKLLSLSKLRKIFETLLYPSKREMRDLPRAELLDIAVLKDHRGGGLAQRLFREFSAGLYELGIEEFKITTGEGLVPAQRFYEKLGATRVATIEVHKGQKTFVYTYRIPKNGSTE